MIAVVFRVVIMAFVLWVLWRLYTARSSTRQSPPPRAHDEWGEVLEAIDELPETTESQPQDHRQPLQLPRYASESAGAPASIEPVLVQEAEGALSRIREGDTNERLAAYHEIATYAKLCSMANCHISEATWRKIETMRRQAWALISPPENR